MTESPYRSHSKYGRIVQLVNDIRLNFGDGKGTLGEVADRIFETIEPRESGYADPAPSLATEPCLDGNATRPLTPEEEIQYAAEGHAVPEVRKVAEDDDDLDTEGAVLAEQVDHAVGETEADYPYGRGNQGPGTGPDGERLI